MHKVQLTSNSISVYLLREYVYQILVLLGFMILLLVGNSASAAVAPSCPSGDQMYYYGANPPAGAITPPNVSWPAGSLSNEFTVNGINFKLTFSETLRLNSGYPKFNSEPDVTTNALNMSHTSQKNAINHKLTATVDRPVSKFGYIVQDLDSNLAGGYIESLSLLTSGGVFSDLRANYFQLSNNNNTVSGTGPPNWTNCNTASTCNFNVDWLYKPKNTPFITTHGNVYANASTTTSGGDHIMGYSDFYFCLAPPKLTVVKALGGTRVSDTTSKRDQFEISVTGGSIAANTFTTTGTGSTIVAGTSAVLNLQEVTTYTITEKVVNGLNLGDIGNYDASYSCTNATTGSTTVMPTTAMSYNSANQTRSFTLSNVTFSDQITCTITNMPKSYTFTGFVFNDNAGITENNSANLNTNTKSDISSTFTSNPKYFNGIFDQGESGISATGLTISLTNCSGTNITGTTAQVVGVSPLGQGQYRFTVPASALANLPNQKVCLVQNEPSDWEFSVDTTPNIREVTLVANTFDYKTESNGSRNLDFGEVKANYTALVLIKSQYLYNCRIVNFNNIDALPTPTNSPREGFSSSPATDAVPGECIAYRIQAFNRGHVDLNDVQISDTLQTTSVKSTFYTPQPNYGIPNEVYTYRSSNPNDVKIESNKFNLDKVPASSSTATKASLFFSTKYGTTSVSP